MSDSSILYAPFGPVYLAVTAVEDQFLTVSLSCLVGPQVPQDEWSNFSPLGKEDDIPCRRMRSGSYVKAMAEDDSGDSDGSPKPSPKIQARRASYLKATQPSLTEMTTLQ